MLTLQKHRSAILFAICALTLVSALAFISAKRSYGAEFPKSSTQPIAYASSTNVALTWGVTNGTQVVATSTYKDATTLIPATAGRSSVTLQTQNCATGGSVWLQFNDVGAGTSTGLWMNGSTTLTLADEMPNFHGSIRAMAAGANCNLLVIENRSTN